MGPDICSLIWDWKPSLNIFQNITKLIFISILRKSCKEFTFGGCEGNGNRYTTQSECESVCLLQEEPLASGAENEEFWAAICKMDIDEG